MFGFIKKLFGGNTEAPKEAAPYKVELQVVDKVVEVNAKPIVKEAAPAAITAPAKKPTPKKEDAKKPTPKKEPAKKPAGKGGRKPKAKAK
jgi:hypothetical protein